jgi:hypothetical protein
MLAALALALVVPQRTTVTFTHPCAHSSAVLEALGREMGVKMAAGGSVLKDYFAVRFTDREPEVVKRLIAETLNAEWVQRGEYLVLDRGPLQEKKEAEQKNLALMESIEGYLRERPPNKFDPQAFKARALDVVAAGGDADLSSPTMKALRAESPEFALAPALLRAIGTDRLLALEDGSALEYRFTATGAQGVPAEVVRIMERYLDDSDQAREIAAGLGLNLRNLHSRPKADKSLVLRISRASNSLMVALRTDPLVYGDETPMPSYLARVGSATAGAPRVPLPPLEGKLGLGGRARSLLRVASSSLRRELGSGDPPSEEDWSTATRAAVALEREDALGLYGALPLSAAAGQWECDYIALVDDSQAFGSPWLTIAETATFEQVWAAWCTGHVARLDDATGVLTVVPEDPRRSRSSRFDRRATSRYAASFEVSGRETLEAAAELALASETPSDHGYNMRAAHALLPVRGPGWGRCALRVYGSLNAAQRREAENRGAVFDWDHLPLAAKEALQTELDRQFVFFSDAPPAPVNWHSFSVQYSSRVQSADRTGAGIPRDAKVRVLCWRTTGLMPDSPLPENDEGVYTPEVYAKFGPKGPIRSEGDTELSKPTATPIAVIDAERVQVEVFLPGLGYTAMAAHVSSRTRLTKFLPPDQLPEPWKTRVAEAIKKNGGGTP